MPECPICKNTVNSFHKRSHIFPDFIIRGLSDHKNRTKLLKSDGSEKTLQTGLWAEIICENCEIQMGKNDRFGAAFFRDEKFEVEKKTYSQSGHVYEQWEGMNFKEVQSFIFSILMRYHLFRLSNEKESPIKPIYFEKLRKIYLDPSFDDENVPILLTRLISKKGLETIAQYPYKSYLANHRAVEFTLLGYEFSIFTSSHRKPDFLRKFQVCKRGKAILMHSIVEEKKSVINFISEFHNSSIKKK